MNVYKSYKHIQGHIGPQQVWIITKYETLFRDNYKFQTPHLDLVENTKK